MTRLLEEAVAAMARLPAGDQDAVASLILAELEAEKGWQEALAKNPEKLQRLADEALEDIRAGRVTGLDVRAI